MAGAGARWNHVTKVDPDKPLHQGIVDGAAMLQSLHDVRTKGLRDTNISQHYTFELWFDEEKLEFYMHAADGNAADEFRRRWRPRIGGLRDSRGSRW